MLACVVFGIVNLQCLTIVPEGPEHQLAGLFSDLCNAKCVF